jgi:hypothetical protein
MGRAPDRLWQLVVAVLSVGVTCTLAENDGAGAPLQGSGKSRREPARAPSRGLEENQHVVFEVTQGPKGLQATHVRAA